MSCRLWFFNKVLCISLKKYPAVVSTPVYIDNTEPIRAKIVVNEEDRNAACIQRAYKKHCHHKSRRTNAAIVIQNCALVYIERSMTKRLIKIKRKTLGKSGNVSV